MKRRLFSSLLLASAAFTAAGAQAEDTVKVGVLHSLSGTMAISETSLRDVLLFTFDEINAAGGVMGKKLSLSLSMALPTGRSSLRKRSSFWSRTKFP